MGTKLEKLASELWANWEDIVIRIKRPCVVQGVFEDTQKSYSTTATFSCHLPWMLAGFQLGSLF